MYFAGDEHRWFTLEADAEIVDGPDTPARLLRVREDKPAEPIDHHSDRGHHTGLDDDAFKGVMAEEAAVLYRFQVTRAYGIRWPPRPRPAGRGRHDAAGQRSRVAEPGNRAG